VGSPVGWGSSGSSMCWNTAARGAGIPAEDGSSSPMQTWGLVGTKRPGARWSGAAALRAYGVGTWWADCSFSRLLCGEDFHDLGVWSAEVLALPGALPQLSMSPVSASSLIHRVHTICSCVPITILDPLQHILIRFTPSIIFPHPPSFLEQFQQVSFSILMNV
jgi:hypothetical protein